MESDSSDFSNSDSDDACQGSDDSTKDPDFVADSTDGTDDGKDTMLTFYIQSFLRLNDSI